MKALDDTHRQIIRGLAGHYHRKDQYMSYLRGRFGPFVFTAWLPAIEQMWSDAHPSAASIEDLLS